MRTVHENSEREQHITLVRDKLRSWQRILEDNAEKTTSEWVRGRSSPISQQRGAKLITRICGEVYRRMLESYADQYGQAVVAEAHRRTRDA